MHGEQLSRTKKVYGLALLLVAFAFALRFILVRALGEVPSYVTFYPAVMLIALIGGLGPGLFATALSVLGMAFWTQPGGGSGSTLVPDAIGIGLFSTTSVLVSVLARFSHRTGFIRAADRSDEPQVLAPAVVRSNNGSRQGKPNADHFPHGEISNLELAEIIDAGAIQSLMEDCYQIAHLPMAIIDLKGRVLVGVGWQDVCTKFHRVHPESRKHCVESDTQLSAGVAPGEFRLYKCRNNMWDIATPIMVGGKHVGNLFSGQFFFEGEPLDHRLFRAQAKRYGFQEEAYVAALESVPRFSRSKVHSGMSFLIKLAELISLLSYSNIRLARSLTEREARERRLQELNRTLTALNNSNQALVRATQESALLRDVCRIIVEDCGHAMVWVGFAEDDENKTVRPVAHAGFEEGYLETLNVTWADTERGRGPTGTAIRTGRPSGCRNMLTDPAFAPWREQAIQRGYASSVVVPLMAEGKAFGAITIYSRDADAFTDDAVKLLTELAGDLAYGLRAIRVRNAHAQATESLREREALLRTMSEGIPDPLFIKDRECRIVLANPATLRVVGKPAGEVVGRNDSEFYDDPAVGRKIMENDRHVMESGRTVVVEETVFTSDGKRVFLSTKTPWRDAEGRVIGIIGNARDITERKRMEEALADAKLSAEQSKAAEEEANRAKDHFLAVLSHELRTPLAPVLMTVSALESDRSLPESLREEMGLIRRSVNLEVRLIDDLLDINRISRGKLELRTRQVDAHATIGAAVEMCQLEARENGVMIETELGANNFQVHADASRLQQVFWNLIRNAIKFTPRGGRVRVCTSNEGGTLGVRVVDSGVGIPSEILPRLFNAFEQGGSQVTRQFGGLGLGLAISKALVEMQGGRISASSDGPGRGATFSVDLPTVSAPAPKPDEQPAPAAAPCVALRILVVEDSPATLRVLERLLRGAGHEVKTATSVREGLEVGCNGAFDLLIGDLGLPDGSGLDVMRQLRMRDPCLPGIALSGYGMESDIERSREAGFGAHLTKPVELQTLQATIKGLVGNRAGSSAR